jgi:sugar phosphate isomerase/epimerase
MNNFIVSGFSDEIHENFDIQLESVKQLGINYIEIRGVNGKNISTLSREELVKVKKQLDENQIKVSSIGSPIGKIFIHDDFDQHLNVFHQIVEAAKLLETHYIRMFSFFIPKGDDPALHKEEVIRRLRVLVKIAEENDLMLLHENEKDIYGDTVERCLEIVEAIGSPYFKLIFDFANFIQCGEETYEGYLRIKQYVKYFHIKDALKHNGHVVPAGSGDGRIRDILRLAIKGGYQGFVSLEPHLGHFKGLQDLELDLELEEVDDNGFERFKLAHKELMKILDSLK